MKESKTTRFEVGMPVIAIIDGETKITKVIFITDTVQGASYPVRIEWQHKEHDYKSVFTAEGLQDGYCEIPSLFTLPEYEALKALTDSFVDGTFGATAKRQEMVLNPNPKPSAVVKFEPTIDELVIYDGKELNIESMYRRASIMCVLSNRTHTAIGNLSPVEGYQYANGFCIPLLKEVPKDNPIVSTNPIETFKDGETEKPIPINGGWKEQTDIEQPETTDLLDENGQPVYFEVGIEVFDICFGRMGMVKPNIVGNSDVYVDWQDYGSDSYTFDGRMSSSHNQTLFLVSQFEQVQLPKLKPIQVPKPKSDVISLPSWFKGGVVIPMYSISEYLTKNTSKDIEDKLNEYILIANSGKYAEVEFYELTKRVIEHEPPIRAIKFAFVCKSMYFEGYLDLDGSQNSYLARMYELNAKPIEEVLTDENNWHICE